ncbi:DUF4826 family protein [Aliikangiella coralliicola]|uniref:DUF4826 family protein n=1 Tax=Aliikangiella coralliicola TaxID=2592383 RepID=A0A545U4N5_9GAMM|nr:DUF4826 family protein [Aliikangiella coralliicola]TQV84404.1 DUF4826 family protein [Aliikangiella coralliicola]
MSQQAQAEALSQEEAEAKIKRWNQEEFVKIQKFCQSQGVQIKGLKQNMCQCLPPVIGVWYIQSATKGEDYWVISGDFPTDLANASVAKNAREALRYFSMSWQIKAANLEDALAEGKIQLNDKETQQKFAKDLVEKAEKLYVISHDEKLWAQVGLKLS